METVRDTLGTLAGATGMKREMKIYRVLVTFLLVLIIVAFIGMFAAVFLAVSASKEVSTSHGRLTDTSGRSISTSQRHDPLRIDPQVDDKGRRLSAMINITAGIDFEIPASVFYQTKATYAKGATNFVVHDAAGTLLTVEVTGWGPNSAWGQCAECSGNYKWIVSCQVDEAALKRFPDTMCPGQRLDSPKVNDENDEDQELDRSLWDKDDCWR